MSQKLVDYLKLSTEPHEKPYTLGLVSKGSQVRLNLPMEFLSPLKSITEKRYFVMFLIWMFIIFYLVGIGSLIMILLIEDEIT